MGSRKDTPEPKSIGISPFSVAPKVKLVPGRVLSPQLPATDPIFPSLLLGMLSCPAPIPITAVGAVKPANGGVVFPVSIPSVP